MHQILEISTYITLTFAILLVANVLTQLWLNSRQARHVWTHRDHVPRAFASDVSLAAHQKAADYTLAKLRLSNLDVFVSHAVLLGWTLMGGLDAMNQWLLASLGSGMTQQIALLTGVVVLGSLIELPFAWWRTFKLEAAFGFNKTTPALWLSDLAKSAVLGAALGLPLAWVALWLMGAAGSYWWLYVWAVWASFNALMLFVYPKWIAPRFNKFEPLTREDVKASANALIEACGFKAEGLFVMDGSRRSAHTQTPTSLVLVRANVWSSLTRCWIV